MHEVKVLAGNTSMYDPDSRSHVISIISKLS